MQKYLNEIKEQEIETEEWILSEININQNYWIKNGIIEASGFCISSDRHISLLLEQMFYITDIFGEPSFEDTKTIEWNFENGQKIIIVLPKKVTKVRSNFHIISGKIDFLNKTEVWKTNL